MIESVTIINYLGDSIVMDLDNPYDSGFAICSINGLGPVKANINVTELATDDGAFYNSARTQTRNITMSLKFFDTSQRTVEDVRLSSYKFFPIKKPVTFIVKTDNRTAYCIGYVESNEPDIFSRDERANISLLCPDPWFYEYGEGEYNTTVFNGIQNLLEFPLENNSIEENLIEVSALKPEKIGNIYYKGDVEIGFLAELHFRGPATNIVLYNVTSNEQIIIATDKITRLTGAPIQDKDEIIIDTRHGMKDARLLRNGVYYGILNALGRDADWFMIHKGDNLIGYAAEEGEDNITVSITNQVAYEGV